MFDAMNNMRVTCRTPILESEALSVARGPTVVDVLDRLGT